MEAALSDNESVSIDPLNQIDLVAASGAAPSVAPSNGLQPSQMAPTELLRWIEAFCSATTLQKRNAALIGLVGWMRKPAASVADLSGLPGLVEFLEVSLAERTRFQAAFAESLSQMNCVSLFAEAGIPSDHSFVSEIGYRISARLLPSAREQSDAAKLLVMLYPTERNVRRFLESPPEVFQRLVGVLTPPSDPQFASHEHQDLLEALRPLGSRARERK